MKRVGAPGAPTSKSLSFTVAMLPSGRSTINEELVIAVEVQIADAQLAVASFVAWPSSLRCAGEHQLTGK